jgi:glycine dehydrogenase
LQPAATQSVDPFVPRHVGPSAADVDEMVRFLGYDSLDALIDDTVPASIRMKRALALPRGMSEHEALASMRAMASENQLMRSYLGFGYSDCITPPVIQRNVL